MYKRQRLYRQNYALTYEGKFDHFDNKTYVAFDKTKNSRLPEYLAGGPEGSYSSTSAFSDSIPVSYTHLDHILIATGGRPSIPAVKGAEYGIDSNGVDVYKRQQLTVLHSTLLLATMLTKL